MATIEPRLMHLLNEPRLSQSPQVDLPPIQKFPFTGGDHQHPLSLPPLELDAGQRGERLPAQGLSTTRGAYTIAPLQLQPGDDGISRHTLSQDAGYNNEDTIPAKKPSHTLRDLLEDLEPNDSSDAVRARLHDYPEFAEDPATKKRPRGLPSKDDVFQLPQPLKRQKSSQQVMPPIINGLHEPPPNAAVFPPISSADFDENDHPTLHQFKDTSITSHNGVAAAKSTETDKKETPKSKRRAAKPRRRWSEEETNHLLLGVSRHGVGKWTTILEDFEFKFNNRTAGDLKDRFRTCCPHELRGKISKKNSVTESDLNPGSLGQSTRNKESLVAENIISDTPNIEQDLAAEDVSVADHSAPVPDTQPNSKSPPKTKKSRAHRKKVQDLVELGIRGPFKKSHRRERRPFTEQDDREILEGLDKYGPAWTKIQRDPRFSLSSRQPTDLRDRVRNKYIEIYARIEKGNLQTKEDGRNSGPLEPSVHTTIENTLTSVKSGPLEPSLDRSHSRETLPRWPSFLDAIDAWGSSQAFDPTEPASSALHFTPGEMDISRLLLDDSQLSAGHKQDGG